MNPEVLPAKPFLECQAPYAQARYVVLGAPLDHTGTYRPGTRFGPAAIREASQSLESYCPAMGRDLASLPIHDAGELVLPAGDVGESLRMIREAAERILNDGKGLLVLGGEHLLTLPLVEALAEQYRDLAVLHFDAHADLRDTYQGNPLSHATVMCRVMERIGSSGLLQFGIRSFSQEEQARAATVRQCPVPFLDQLEEVLEALGSRPLYVSVDMDVLDPAYAPGTGTPEPGGVTAREMLEAIRLLERCRVVAADVVEVCPPYDPSGITGLLAATLCRDLLLIMGSKGA